MVGLLDRAARAGHRKAQAILVNRYSSGTGIPTDPGEALAWYRKAAQDGDVAAQALLGELYENGRWVEQDVPGAIVWYRRAAESGVEIALLKLAGLYMSGGPGVLEDTAESYFWILLTLTRGVEKMRTVLPYYDKQLTQSEKDAAHRKAIEWMDKHWTTIDLSASTSRLF